jgi:hypothetical protein
MHSLSGIEMPFTQETGSGERPDIIHYSTFGNELAPA